MGRALSLSKDRAVAFICSVGNRAEIGVSMLKKARSRKVYNVLDNMMLWEKLAYPTKKK